MLDGMRLKISQGNSKIGGVPNLSLPPVLTCRENAPCIKECYARKSYDRWPAVRRAWDSNLELYKTEPEVFFNDLCLYLAVAQPRRFRLFVGGDFPDVEFFVRFVDIAETYHTTQFLCFTKQYEFLHGVDIPDNLNLVLSIWPGLEMPHGSLDSPTAWLSTDTRFDTYYTNQPFIHCPGSCDTCGHQCWHGISVDLPVKFDPH